MWSLWHQLAWGWSLHENLQLHITPVHVIVSVNSCVGIDTKIKCVYTRICLKAVGSQARILYSNEEEGSKLPWPSTKPLERRLNIACQVLDLDKTNHSSAPITHPLMTY